MFDPIAFTIFGFAIRWYALAYIAGIVLGWLLAKRLLRYSDEPSVPSAFQLEQFTSWAVFGIIIGGRIGYTTLYNWDYYSEHLLEILYVWKGGMAFHGGMLGVAAALYLFSRQAKLPLWRLPDVICCVAPLGIFLGRLSNFINGELWGRVTTSSWGMVFPHSGDLLPRHPSQLYQAFGEGLLLLLILVAGARFFGWLKTPWRCTAVFLGGYGALRFAAEFFREPDVQLGFILSGLTQGQLLCIPMIVAGFLLWFIAPRYARRNA
ncbi:MAG: prolipoprotein diacylglyceryl transferase [Holosporales bacterium]